MMNIKPHYKSIEENIQLIILLNNFRRDMDYFIQRANELKIRRLNGQDIPITEVGLITLGWGINYIIGHNSYVEEFGRKEGDRQGGGL